MNAGYPSGNAFLDLLKSHVEGSFTASVGVSNIALVLPLAEQVDLTSRLWAQRVDMLNMLTFHCQNQICLEQHLTGDLSGCVFVRRVTMLLNECQRGSLDPFAYQCPQAS